jgi:secreted trypsin-like serine protease
MRIILPCLLSIALTACAPDGSPTMNLDSGTQILGIKGGRPVSPNSLVAHSVVAVMGRSSEGGYLCTGTLISDDSVLTAAHCAVDLQHGEIIFSTDLSTSNPNLRRPIQNAEVHSQYVKTEGRLQTGHRKSPNGIKNWGDIAILRFAGRMPRGYHPATLGGDEALANGQSVILAGYGLTDGENQTPSDSLRAVEVPVKNATYSQSEFTVHQIDNKGPCHGDSGGPAFVLNGRKVTMIGITSRGFDATCLKDSIFTKVSTFQEWIFTVIRRG